MMSQLRRRYFPTAAEEQAEAEAARAAAREVRTQRAAFVKHPEFAVLQEKMEKLLRANKVKPESHESMLYQAGKEEGIRMVVETLQGFVQECRGGEDGTGTDGP